MWGRAGWTFIHACSFGYPDEPDAATREAAFLFTKSIASLVPCPTCRQHYKDLVKGIKDHNDRIFSSRDNFSRFFVDVHNSVNRRLDREEFRYDAVRSKYVSKTSCPLGHDKRYPAIGIRTVVSVTVAIVLIGMLMVEQRRNRRNRSH